MCSPSFDFSIKSIVTSWWTLRKSCQQPAVQSDDAVSSNLSLLQRIGRAISKAFSKFASCFSIFGKRGLQNRTSLLDGSAYIGRPRTTASPVNVNQQSSPELEEPQDAEEEEVNADGPPGQIMELPGQRDQVVLQQPQDQLEANLEEDAEEESPLLVLANTAASLNQDVVGIPVSHPVHIVTGIPVEDDDGPVYSEDDEDYSLKGVLASGVKTVVTTVTPQFVQDAAVRSGTFVWNYGLGWLARKTGIVSSNPTPVVTPSSDRVEEQAPPPIVVAISRPVSPPPMLVAHVDTPLITAPQPFEREETRSTATTEPLSSSSSGLSGRSSPLSDPDREDRQIDGAESDADNDQQQVVPPLFQIPEPVDVVVADVPPPPVDHLAALPKLSPYQEEGTKFTIQTLAMGIGAATTNALKLRGYEKGSSQNPGVAAAHPLRFLECIINNESALIYTYQGDKDSGKPCLTKIVNYSGFTGVVGKEFRKNLFANLTKADSDGTLIPNLDGFAKAIGKPGLAQPLQAAAQAKNWKQFLKVLVPDYGMY